MLKGLTDGALACAIQLVCLGADCEAKLIIPESFHGAIATTWRRLGINNKTAQELAILSGKKKLVDVMETFHDRNRMIELVHCRCGSRLPWKDCHLGQLPRETVTKRTDRGSQNFRYSPLAPCFCRKTKKSHFLCCWESSSPRYLNDKTAELYGADVLISSTGMWFEIKEAIHKAADRDDRVLELKRVHGDDAGLINYDRNRKSVVHAIADKIRISGLGGLIEASGCKVREMDPKVYADIFENLDTIFYWRDDHWMIDKSILISRRKEWNKALEQYCSENEIYGGEKEQVVKLHAASPLAPCANPSCNKVEEKVKEFCPCSACRTVAYCSIRCQKKHWKTHKSECFKR